ncbi:transcriptional regulator [Xylanimonas protaetiae]|nr:transcriptional regulator [Xylanimonas protaetiae]
MSLADLDPVIHAPKRLAAMGILSGAESATFAYLRDNLELTDSDLSKQMSALEAAGYVKSHKQGRGPGSVTTFVITRQGTKAFRAHRAALMALLAEHPPTA